MVEYTLIFTRRGCVYRQCFQSFSIREVQSLYRTLKKDSDVHILHVCTLNDISDDEMAELALKEQMDKDMRHCLDL